MADLEEDQYLVVSVRRRPHYYVQFAQGGPKGFRAETVSNAFLPGDEHLDNHEQGELLVLGWQPPQPDVEGSGPNYHRDWEAPVPFAEVSALAVRTLNKVMSVARPGLLSYKAFAKGGAQIIISALGIPRETFNKDEQKPSEPALAHSAEELLEQVKQAMRPLLGADEVTVDEDGDIPVRYGSVMAYIRVLKDMPVVRIFSPVIYDIGEPADILATINDINKDVLYAKALWDGKAVLLAADVSGAPLAVQQLQRAYEAISQLADEYAHKLQDRYGGRVAFGPSLPAKAEGNLPGYL